MSPIWPCLLIGLVGDIGTDVDGGAEVDAQRWGRGAAAQDVGDVEVVLTELVVCGCYMLATDFNGSESV